MTIELPKKTPHYLVLVIEHLVKNLQQRFDISPELFQKWLLDPDFLTWAQQTYHKTETEMLGDLMSRPKIAELREIYHSKQPMEILIHHLGWEQEACGYLYERYDNSYQHYCNLSRFEHSKHQTNHQFTRKTYQQMIDEKIFNSKLEAYQEFLEQMLVLFLKHLDQKLKQDYQIHRLTGSKIKPQVLSDWLKSHPEAFKAKMGLIRQINPREEFLDIYLPKESPPKLPYKSLSILE